MTEQKGQVIFEFLQTTLLLIGFLMCSYYFYEVAYKKIEQYKFGASREYVTKDS